MCDWGAFRVPDYRKGRDHHESDREFAQRTEVSPNHPASGNLSQEEFDESGYDGPMVDDTDIFGEPRESTRSPLEYLEEDLMRAVDVFQAQVKYDPSGMQEFIDSLRLSIKNAIR